jgi:hypothetical protein
MKRFVGIYVGVVVACLAISYAVVSHSPLYRSLSLMRATPAALVKANEPLMIQLPITSYMMLEVTEGTYVCDHREGRNVVLKCIKDCGRPLEISDNVAAHWGPISIPCSDCCPNLKSGGK